MNTHLSSSELNNPYICHIPNLKEKNKALKWLSNLQGKEYNEITCHQLSDGVVFLQVSSYFLFKKKKLYNSI